MFQFTGFPLYTYWACAYSVHSGGGLLRRVSPFRNLRIMGYVLLPAAFRSLSRLSSALSAKASALRPFCLTFRLHHPSVGDAGLILIADKFLYRCLPILRVTPVSAQHLLCNFYQGYLIDSIKSHVCSFQGTYLGLNT